MLQRRPHQSDKSLCWSWKVLTDARGVCGRRLRGVLSTPVDAGPPLDPSWSMSLFRPLSRGDEAIAGLGRLVASRRAYAVEGHRGEELDQHISQFEQRRRVYLTLCSRAPEVPCHHDNENNDFDHVQTVKGGCSPVIRRPDPGSGGQSPAPHGPTRTNSAPVELRPHCLARTLLHPTRPEWARGSNPCCSSGSHPRRPLGEGTEMRDMRC